MERVQTHLFVLVVVYVEVMDVIVPVLIMEISVKYMIVMVCQTLLLCHVLAMVFVILQIVAHVRLDIMDLIVPISSVTITIIQVQVHVTLIVLVQHLTFVHVGQVTLEPIVRPIHVLMLM